LIINGKLDTYWSKVGGQTLTEDFKDLILKMFSYDPSKRPTVDELRTHPWMTKGQCDVKGIRSDLIERLSSIRSEKTAASSNNMGEATRAGKGAD
jgi:serine/threonine protein kinase